MTPEIEQYLRELLQEAGQSGLDAEIEKTLMADLYTRLEERLMLTAMQHLAEDQQQDLEKMAAEKKDQAQIQAYIQRSIPDYEKVFAQALMDFRNAYVAGSGA